MNTEKALKALAAQDAALEAAPYVEAQLLEAYRRKHARGAWRRALPWVMAVAAAGLLFAVLRPQPPVAVVGRTPWSAADAPVGLAAEPEKPARGPHPEGTRDLGVRPTPAPVEITTEFYPLLEIAPPFERGELVRVTVPASAMRRVGIPVREERLLDPVQADILYGQEGLARAIRFVRLEQ